MADPNNVQFAIEIDTSRGNAAIVSFNRSMSGMEGQAVRSARAMSTGMDDMGVEMYQARGAAMMLESQIGMKLPRAVNTFLARNALIGPALEMAFGGAAVVAIGVAIFEASKKFGWFGEETEKAKKAQDELNKSLKEQVEQLDKNYESLEKIRRARGLIGLEGSAKGAIELKQAQADVVRARIELDDANAKFNQIY